MKKRERLLSLLVLLLLCTSSLPQTGRAQDDVKIWEFSPYEVELWYSFSPRVTISQEARQQFLHELQSDIDRSFRAAWRLKASPLSPEWTATVERNFHDFTVQDITRNELSVAVSTKHEATKTVRTLEAAVEQLDKILITEQQLGRLQKLVDRFDLAEDSLGAQLLSKCKVEEGLGVEELKEKLGAAEIPAVLLPKNEIDKIRENIRMLLSPLPWHTDSILRKRDKIIFLTIDQQGDAVYLQARELDCPMQFMGPTFSAEIYHWPYAARSAAHCVTKAFAPIARVEQSESTTANLLHRAGGLIMRPENPAKLSVGDVMQPIVRRDDKNGRPTLLQPLSWTFAAITASDGVKMEANVYTYSGGPGLQGRRNRRTQRIVLRVRPTVDKTDVRIVVRGSDKPQAGCFVYQRDLLTDEFEELGRTDWRGHFAMEVPGNGSFLQADLKRNRSKDKRTARSNLERARGDFNSISSDESQADKKRKKEALDAAEAAMKPYDNYDPAKDKDAIPLNYPLIQIYIKNGNTVLARLPMVPGLQPIETAELNDDSRRLQAEAFLNGFSGDLVSIIGLRQIFAARIKLNLKEKKVKDASRNLSKMRQIQTYEEKSSELEAILRDMYDKKRGEVAFGQKRQMDRMFKTVSDMLQQFLQDNLYQTSMESVRQAGGDVSGKDL